MFHIDTKGIILTVLSNFFAFIAVATAQEWAAVAAILAGFSTFALNIYRFYKEKNKK